jgi:uncharacterized protein (DUF433 family)
MPWPPSALAADDPAPALGNPLLLFHACVLAVRRYIQCMEGLDRITIEPGKMGGQPCIRGHRFTVEHLLSLVGAGWTLEQIQTDFPFIEAADIQQSSAYAAFSVREYHLPVTRPA